jgi:hypothetical protein
MGSDALFKDAETDPLWQTAGLLANTPPRPAKGYATVPLAWLERVLPVTLTTTHLVVAMLLYSKCLRQRSQTVTLSNGEVKRFGISRYAKYRTLASLHRAGMIAIEGRNGRSIRVTLLWFP